MNNDTDTILQLSEKAITAVKKISSNGSGKTLRLYVESGGCSGMQYGMGVDAPKEGDFRVEIDGAMVCVDREAVKYLKGSLLDYSDSLAYTGFRIQNPNAKQTCGCGTSFEPEHK